MYVNKDVHIAIATYKYMFACFTAVTQTDYIKQAYGVSNNTHHEISKQVAIDIANYYLYF